MKAKQYKITSFEQIQNIITPENSIRLLTDFGAYLLMYVDMTEKLRKAEPVKTKGKRNTELFDSYFIWVDDGKTGVTKVHLTSKETGETKIIQLKKP